MLIKCEACSSQVSEQAKACPHCGHPVQTELEVIIHPTTSVTPVNACPVCRENTQVQLVQNILDVGMGTTVGTAISAPITGHGGLQGAMYAAQSSNNLSKRLAGRSKPRPGFSVYFGGYVFAVFIYWVLFSSLVTGDSNDPLVFGFFFLPATIILAIPSIIFFYLIKKSSLKPKVANWNQANFIIRNSYYCHRDGVAFNKEFHSTPDQFVGEIYRRCGL